jgi:hypothetical protein
MTAETSAGPAWWPTTTLTNARAVGAALVAAASVVLVHVVGWTGPDVPAQLYRVMLFRTSGFALWDTHWYAGHALLPYSVLYPALGAAFGVYGAAALAAAVAAWSFDRIVREEFGTSSWLASAMFVSALAVPVIVGQFAFLCGEASALVALVLWRKARVAPMLVSAIAAALFSPVAAVLLIVIMGAVALVRGGDRRQRSLVAIAGAATPLVVLTLTYPNQGTFPYKSSDLVVTLMVAALFACAAPRRYAVIRVAACAYGVVAVVDFLVPNALGANYERLALAVSPALLLALARLSGRRWLFLGVVPLLVWQWSPAVPALVAAGPAGSDAAYYRPLVRYLRSQPGVGRVEIPFTAAHWESVYVAPYIPLTRGWERQTDIANNPIFYGSSLSATEYQKWLVDQGVTWVALPDEPLDYSSIAEGQLLRARPLPFLQQVWQDQHWKVWRVRGSPGIVAPPARLVTLGISSFVVDVPKPGTLTVRVHYTDAWTVTSGAACVDEAPGEWTRLMVAHPGRVTVAASLFGAAGCEGPDRPASTPTKSPRRGPVHRAAAPRRPPA